MTSGAATAAPSHSRVALAQTDGWPSGSGSALRQPRSPPPRAPTSRARGTGARSAFAWAAGLALAFASDISLSRAELALLGVLGALAGWIALSLAWTASTPETVDEVQRALLYVTAAAAFLLLARREAVGLLLGGLLAALAGICAYALATRLFPRELSTDVFGGYRLSTPVGYWNGLGLLAAFGALLALGFAASERNVVGRALAAAALPLLVCTLYFTYSRGAWVALAAGGVLAVAIDPRRLRLVTAGLALAVPVALPVWLASRSDALTHRGSTLGAAARRGPPPRAVARPVHGARRGHRDRPSRRRAPSSDLRRRSARLRRRTRAAGGRRRRGGAGGRRRPGPSGETRIRRLHLEPHHLEQPEQPTLQPVQPWPHAALARRLASVRGASRSSAAAAGASSSTGTATGPRSRPSGTPTASTCRRSPSSAFPGSCCSSVSWRSRSPASGREDNRSCPSRSVPTPASSSTSRTTGTGSCPGSRSPGSSAGSPRSSPHESGAGRWCSAHAPGRSCSERQASARRSRSSLSSATSRSSRAQSAVNDRSLRQGREQRPEGDGVGAVVGTLVGAPWPGAGRSES